MVVRLNPAHLHGIQSTAVPPNNHNEPGNIERFKVLSAIYSTVFSIQQQLRIFFLLLRAMSWNVDLSNFSKLLRFKTSCLAHNHKNNTSATQQRLSGTVHPYSIHLSSNHACALLWSRPLPDDYYYCYYVTQPSDNHPRPLPQFRYDHPSILCNDQRLLIDKMYSPPTHFFPSGPVNWPAQFLPTKSVYTAAA